jgi:hypothetical protein
MSWILKTAYLAHERSPILPLTFVILPDKRSSGGSISASPLVLNSMLDLCDGAGLQISLCRLPLDSFPQALKDDVKQRDQEDTEE